MSEGYLHGCDLQAAAARPRAVVGQVAVDVQFTWWENLALIVGALASVGTLAELFFKLRKRVGK